MKNIPIKLLKNPSVLRYDEDDFIIQTNFGILGGSFSYQNANAIKTWLLEAVDMLEKTEIIDNFSGNIPA